MLRLLLRHWRHVAVRVVHWLPSRVLLRVLLRVEGRWRAMVEGVRVCVDGRLRRRAIHVAVVLLLAARLLVVGNGRGHGVTARAQMVIHSETMRRVAGAMASSCLATLVIRPGRPGEKGRCC